MSNKTLNFIKELESRFGRTGFVEWAGKEAMRLHALFAAMERPEYRERLTAVCPREELKLSANLLKERLKNLYGALEEQIPELKGVFLGQKFERIDEHELYQLIVLFDREGLTGEEYQNEQLVLDFFQALLDELDSTRKEFIFTPDGLIQLMVRALKPVNGIAYDGTAGICNILTALFRHAEAQDGNLKVYGQEIHPEIYVIGKINLFLHGILPEHGDLALGDTIREPKWLENGTVRQFDYVVMNYPFGLKDWGYEFARNDKYGRFQLYPLPSRSQGDYAFIIHALASLKPDGKAALIVPFGTLVRAAGDRKIRAVLLKDDVIESVTALPSSLFAGTGIQVALLILNKNKPARKKGFVQFINAEGDYERTRTQSFLKPEHVEKIVAALDAYENVEGYSRIVPVKEIAENNYDLNPSLYFVNVELETEFGTIYFNRRKYKKETENLVKIGDVAEVIRGVNLPGKRQMEAGIGPFFPVIQIRDIEEGEMIFDNIERMPIQTKDIERVTAKPGDILVASRGTQQKIAIVPDYEGRLVVSSMFVIIRLHDKNEVAPEYVKRILESPVGRYFFEVSQSGSTVTVLTPNDIRAVEIPLLPPEQQQAFIRELDEADEIVRKALEERKNRYFTAYEKAGFGRAIDRN